MAQPGSRFTIRSNCGCASSYQKSCSNATPRLKGVRTDGEHETAKDTFPSCSPARMSARAAMGSVKRANRSEVSILMAKDYRTEPRHYSAASPPRTSRLELHHHMPRHRVVLERVGRQILAVSRALEAAMRHFAHDREMRVDPGAAVLQPGRDVHGFAHILGPDRGGQAIFGIIRPSHRVIGIRKAGHRN